MASKRGKKSQARLDREPEPVLETLDGSAKKRWIDIVRNYDLEPMNKYTKFDAYGNEIAVTKGFTATLKLDETFEAVESVIPGFKIVLLPHQCVTIRAMLDLELKRHIRARVAGASGYTMPSCFAGDVAIIETCAGVLSDKLGSGKTYCILGVIQLAKNMTMPKVANITDLELPRQEKAMRAYDWKSHTKYIHVGWKTEVRRIYKKLIPLTVIFVSKSVITQWEDSIKEHTNLKVFKIENIYHMTAFYNMMFAPTKENNLKALLKYDIVLVKNGIISGKFEPPELSETGLDGVKTKPILSVFGELFKDFCFLRVVLDDFDTLGIPTTAFVIPAMFTWFVSATKKLISGGSRTYPAKNISDAMNAMRPAYTAAWKNRTLFSFFNISNADSFTDASTQASKVEFFVYNFHNPNESYIGLLGVMGTADAQVVMEALNGDAIQTAAGEVGLKSTSVADIFAKVLDDKWTVYKKNLEIDHYIVGEVEPWYSGLAQADDEYTPLSDTSLTKVSRNLKKPGPFGGLTQLVSYQDPGVTVTITDVKRENTELKEFNGKAINRVRDNLKQGDCPIMATPLKDGPVVILKCCGITVSREAASFSLKLQKTSGAVGDMAGSCPNCRRPIAFSQLIVVDQDLNLDDIVNEVIEPVLSKPSDETDLDLDTVDTEAEELNKYSCIVRIIKGDDTGSDVEAVKTSRNVTIPSMLVGQYDKGIAPASDRKILVYASFGETLDILTQKLIDAGVPYLRLQGKASQIDDMVRRFNMPNDNPESIAVLLVGGPQYCAGLNLQITTDLIFTHKIIDQNVESQVAGRASRFGRKYNLRIHYVLYDNEIRQMFPAKAH